MRRRWIAWAPDAGGAPAGGTPPADGGTGGAPPGGGGAGGGAAPPANGAGAANVATPPAFAEQLPADIREDPVFRDFKDLAGLAKSYHHAKKLLGRDPSTVVAIPGPDDADGWNGVYTRLGRPEKPEEYTLPAPPEGMAESPELKAAFQKAAHEAGLSTKQAERLAAWWNNTAATTVQAQTAQLETAQAANEAKLKGEWGAAYDHNVHLARSALAHYGDPTLVQYLEQTKLGNDPALVKAFAKIGKTLEEDGLIGEGGAGGNAPLSPTEARQQIAALRNDTEFNKAYTNNRAPGHAEAVERMRQLHEFAYPAA